MLLIGGGNDLVATHLPSVDQRDHLGRADRLSSWCRLALSPSPERICLGLQRRDRDTVLHGRETGIIQRLPHGEYIEVHEPLSPGERYTLTAYEQYEPLELPPAVDGAGVERKLSRSVRAADAAVPLLLRRRRPDRQADGRGVPGAPGDPASRGCRGLGVSRV